LAGHQVNFIEPWVEAAGREVSVELSNLRLVLARMGEKDLWRHFRPIQSVARWPLPNGVIE
jgi:hypothetical protein